MTRRSAAARRPSLAGVAAPADRRFHRSERRPERRRIGRAVLHGARWLLLVAAVVAAGGWMTSIALDAGVLAVDRIVVRGTVRLAPRAVRALVDHVRGENILRVDFEDLRRRVLDSPWVAAVAMSRVLPSTIEIRVTERTPMAVARVGQQLFLVDDSGVVIDEFGAPYSDLDLPVVDGLISAPGRGDPLVDPTRVRVTAAFLSSLAARPDLARRLSQIDVTNERDVVAMFDHDPVWLHLGDTQFLERLNTYLELAPTLADRFVGIDYVDLRFGERIFVRSRTRTDRTTEVR
jgi:cell division septal protein FtsQ